MTATESLLKVMDSFDLPVLDHKGKVVVTISGFEIEVEGYRLYKLIHQGEIVSPFDDLKELCEFIKNYS